MHTNFLATRTFPHEGRPTITPAALLVGLLMSGLIPVVARAQEQAAAIAGRIADTAGTPLSGVRVTAVELGRVTLSDSAGGFRFVAVPRGSYTLSFARLGLAPETRRVAVGPDVAPLQVLMHSARVQLSPVQVTATLGATAAAASPQPTAVVEGPELRVANGSALGETLELVPGIRSLSMTSGIGKPVIRGMTHYRVVTLDDGQRTETQAWGHDHSPNVETAAAERVEVIKGPASVLYGSDALGGVVNVVAPSVPDAIGAPAFVRGRAVSTYSQSIRGGEATVQLEGATGGFGARGAATVRGSGDMRTPTGVLHNTNNRATALDGTAGHRGAWGSVSTRYTSRDERIEIFDDPVANPGYTGYQRIATRRGTVELMIPVAASRLEAVAGYEENHRREFADALATIPDLGLHVRNWTGTLHLHHAPVGPLSGTIGTSFMTSRFTNRGTATLIPSSDTRNVALYLLEQVERGRWLATAGARYDTRSLATDGHAGIGVAPQRHTFDALTGSAGLLFRATRELAVVANVARGFRAPAAPDLFANGFHEGTRAFERGDPDLDVETSLNREVGLRITRHDLSAELTGYVNDVDGYIYLRPFGTGGGAFDSLQVVQGDARLTGVEGRVQYHPTAQLTLHASGDYVRGDNLTADIPLTFIPPLRVVYGLRLQPAGNASRYLSLGAESNARQTRLDPRDVGTPGYTIVTAGGGFTRLVPRGTLTVDVSVRNLLDARYRSFMSRYKEFALGPGRGMVLKVGVDF